MACGTTTRCCWTARHWWREAEVCESPSERRRAVMAHGDLQVPRPLRRLSLHMLLNHNTGHTPTHRFSPHAPRLSQPSCPNFCRAPPSSPHPTTLPTSPFPLFTRPRAPSPPPPLCALQTFKSNPTDRAKSQPAETVIPQRMRTAVFL